MRAPFKLSDGSVGIVTVGSLAPGRFGAAEAELLLDLCRPVGIAIDRVRLLGSMARTTAALDAKMHILAALVPGATAVPPPAPPRPAAAPAWVEVDPWVTTTDDAGAPGVARNTRTMTHAYCALDGREEAGS